MDSNLNRKITKAGLVCGIIMLLAGIVITVVCAINIEFNPWWRLASGLLFILLGTIYLTIFNCRKN